MAHSRPSEFLPGLLELLGDQPRPWVYPFAGGRKPTRDPNRPKPRLSGLASWDAAMERKRADWLERKPIMEPPRPRSSGIIHYPRSTGRLHTAEAKPPKPEVSASAPMLVHTEAPKMVNVSASEGLLPIVTFLLENDANVNATDRWGGTPMRDALREGHFGVAKELRDNGGRLEMKENDVSGELCELARRGLLEKLDQLVECGADFDAKDYDDRTALHLASSVGNLPIAEQLLSHGAAVNAKDRWGGTPLRDAHSLPLGF